MKYFGPGEIHGLAHPERQVDLVETTPASGQKSEGQRLPHGETPCRHVFCSSIEDERANNGKQCCSSVE